MDAQPRHAGARQRLRDAEPRAAVTLKLVTAVGMFASSRRRISKVCDGLADARHLRLALLDEIRAVVGFDAYAWLLTDPETTVGSAPLADVPCLSELPRLIALKYLTAINRWTTLGHPPTATLRKATNHDLRRSLLWREILHRYDIGDVASTVFQDRFGCWGFLDLWRSGATASFDDDEMVYLADIAPLITAALRRSQATTFVPAQATGPSWPGPVVLLLSPDLDVMGQTPDTEQYLRVLVPPSDDRPPVPANSYNAGAQLLALEAGIDPHPPSARVHLAQGVWVTVRAARLGDEGPPDQRNIAVTVQTASPGERLGVFARAFGLSARESELLGHLQAGSDTRDLARRMFVSEYTVQDQLKSIFAKTSTRTRASLLSRALGA